MTRNRIRPTIGTRTTTVFVRNSANFKTIQNTIIERQSKKKFHEYSFSTCYHIRLSNLTNRQTCLYNQTESPVAVTARRVKFQNPLHHLLPDLSAQNVYTSTSVQFLNVHFNNFVSIRLNRKIRNRQILTKRRPLIKSQAVNNADNPAVLQRKANAGGNRTTSVPVERIVFLRFVTIKFKFVCGAVGTIFFLRSIFRVLLCFLIDSPHNTALSSRGTVIPFLFRLSNTILNFLPRRNFPTKVFVDILNVSWLLYYPGRGEGVNKTKSKFYTRMLTHGVFFFFY